MQLHHDEFLLLSRTGRVPRARSDGPPVGRSLVSPRAVVEQSPRRKSLVDSLLTWALVARAARIGVAQQRRNR
jgi:hypothetical protein